MPRLSRQDSQQATRHRLRSAARRVFAARGVGATSIDRIAEEAGFSRGAFYANYGSKRELLLEVMAEAHESEIAVWRDLINAAADIETLFPLLEARFNDYVTRPDIRLLGVELQLEAERDPEFGKVFDQYASSVTDQTRELVRTLLSKTGRSDTVDTDIFTIALRSMSFGLMFTNGHGGLMIGRTPGEVMTLFLRGLLALGGGPTDDRR